MHEIIPFLRTLHMLYSTLAQVLYHGTGHSFYGHSSHVT